MIILLAPISKYSLFADLLSHYTDRGSWKTRFLCYLVANEGCCLIFRRCFGFWKVFFLVTFCLKLCKIDSCVGTCWTLIKEQEIHQIVPCFFVCLSAIRIHHWTEVSFFCGFDLRCFETCTLRFESCELAWLFTWWYLVDAACLSFLCLLM